jgi:hypothetical protein
MHTPFRNLVNLFLLATWLSLAGTALAEEKDLKTAMQQLIAHGDLADTDALTKILGLSFRIRKVTQFADSQELRYETVVTESPSFVLASDLHYKVFVNKQTHQSDITLTLRPRKCPYVETWAREWKLEIRSSILHDGAGWSYFILPSTPNGIVLHEAQCQLDLTQTQAKIVSFPAPMTQSRDGGQALAEQVVALIAAGDLRDVATTQRILQADLSVDPRELRNGKLFKASVLLKRVIPGMNPDGFSYSANDTGWQSPPQYYVLPQELSERRVDLALPLDTTWACLNASDIAAQLDLKAIPYGKQSKNDAETVFKILGENEISLYTTASEGCVERLWFHQTTDVAHNLSGSVKFSNTDSITKSKQLTAEAKARLGLMMERIRTIQLKQIEIDQHGNAADLVRLIKDFLIEQGISAELITLSERPAASSVGVEVRPLANW